MISRTCRVIAYRTCNQLSHRGSLFGELLDLSLDSVGCDELSATRDRLKGRAGIRNPMYTVHCGRVCSGIRRRVGRRIRHLYLISLWVKSQISDKLAEISCAPFSVARVLLGGGGG